MGTTKNVFRPSLILFIGEAGATVYQKFCQRLNPMIPAPIEYIQKPYLSWIGFVRPGENNACYQQQFASSDSSTGSDNFKTALSHMNDNFAHAMAESSLDTSFEQNNDEANNKPEIFIVGHVSDPAMRAAVSLLYDEKVPHRISCLCCCYPVKQAQNEHGDLLSSHNQSNVPEDLAEWGRKQQVECCYLFGDNASTISEDVADRDKTDYAIALALLSLLNAGTSLQDTSKKTPPSLLNADTALQDTSKKAHQCKIGTLSSCLITVPQEAILSACRCQVAALMIAHWLIKSEALRQNEEVRKLVENDVQVIKQWIMDHGQETRPGANVQEKLPWWSFPKKAISIPPTEQYTWPDLSILNNGQPEDWSLYNDLVRSTEDLFQQTPAGICPLSQKWLDRAEQHYDSAQKQTRQEWTQHASSAWNAVCEKTRNLLNTTLQDLANKKERGAAWIIAYADTLDEALKKLQEKDERHLEQGADHQEGYLLEHDPERDAHLQPQIAPLRAAMERQPTISTLLLLLGFACMSMFLLTPLFANICAPVLGEQDWPQWIAAGLLSLMSIVAINWFFLRRFYLPGILEKHALLRSYRHAHASYCSNEEQKQRASIIQALRLSIEDMRSENLKRFKHYFEEDARQQLATLFHTAEASRCLFVDDNRYFKQNEEFATYTFLQKMPGRSSQQRPKAELLFDRIVNDNSFSHASAHCLSTLKQSSQSTTTQEQTNATSCQTEAFYRQISTLMESSVRADTLTYHNDDSDTHMQSSTHTNKMLSLSTSYKDNDMWNDVFKRLNGKLWSKQEGVEKAQHLFVCGPEIILPEILLRISAKYQGHIIDIGIPSNATTEQTAPDWFLVAALSYDPIVETTDSTK